MSTASPLSAELSDSAAPSPLVALYRDHHRWLQGWLQRRLGNGFDAADLAQDTYLRLLRRDQQELHEIREPRALLTTIAQALAANLHRRRCVEQAYLDALAVLPESVAPSAEQRAMLLEALVEVDRQLAQLPEPVRRAFLLSQLDGLKQSDIAAELGVSVPTVKRYIARALVQVCFLDEDGV